MFPTLLSAIVNLLFHMVILIPGSLNEAAKTIACIAEQLAYEYEKFGWIMDPEVMR